MEIEEQQSPDEKPIQTRPYPLWLSFGELALIAGVILLLDQWTKSWVRSNLALGEAWMPWDWLAPFARIVNWHNDGAVFGLFSGQGDIFMALAIIVAGLIIYYFPRIGADEWPLRLAMSLQLGGALGNLVDRLQRGYVTDFISVGNFWVFNIADAAVTVGAGILVLMLIMEQRQEVKQQSEAGE